MTNTTKTAEKPKRRSPITRAEGEKRLIEAAEALIKQKPFSEVGVREIAEKADVNHGFVHTWFGSKNDLFLAVVLKLANELAADVEKATPGQPALNAMDPKVILLVRLLMWLDLEGVNIRAAIGDLPVISAIADRLIHSDNIDPSIARVVALQAVTIGIGTATFARLLGTEDQRDLSQVFVLWRHIIGLLAKHPPA